MRRTVVLALAVALAGSTGCAGGLTKNHQQGLAIVGGVTVIVGGTVLMDGMSCDESNWNGASCSHDTAELRNGAILVGAGGALLGWALWQLASDQPAPEVTGPRTARVAPSAR